MISKRITKLTLRISGRSSWLLILLLPVLAPAAGLNHWPATGLTHPWATSVNPALISWQNSRVSLGHKVYHLGFLPDNSLGLRESHINASFPYQLPLNLGIGLDLQYYAAGIYSEFFSAIMLSREFMRQFSLGLKLGVEQRAFAKDNFVLADQNDPLLSKGLSHVNMNLGCGLYWRPGRFSVGLGLDHLNQPNIAMQAKALMPLEISGAIGYDFGWLQPAIRIHDQGDGLQFGLTLSTVHQRLGSLRLSFENNMPVHLEASIALGKLSSLQYGFDLAGAATKAVSYGSHELVYTHILGQEPDILPPEILFSTAKLEIVEETVVRAMASGLNPDRLIKLAELAPEFLDVQRKPLGLVIVSPNLPARNDNTENRNHHFAQLAGEIKTLLQQNPDLKIVLRLQSEDKQDAVAFRNYLNSQGVPGDRIALGKINSTGAPELSGFTPGRQMVTRKKPELSHGQLLIDFSVPGRSKRLKNWRFTIVNQNGKKVRTFTGKDRLPETLVWNWQNETGHVVPPGNYTGMLQMEAKSGKTITAQAPALAVQFIKRTVNLRFDTAPTRPSRPAQPIHEVAKL